jgi:hypothetical protein
VKHEPVVRLKGLLYECNVAPRDLRSQLTDRFQLFYEQEENRSMR